VSLRINGIAAQHSQATCKQLFAERLGSRRKILPHQPLDRFFKLPLVHARLPSRFCSSCFWLLYAPLPIYIPKKITQLESRGNQGLSSDFEKGKHYKESVLRRARISL
jgi:hypothetical protein